MPFEHAPPNESLPSVALMQLGMKQTGRLDASQSRMFGTMTDNDTLHFYAFDENGHEWGTRKVLDPEGFKQQLIERGFVEIPN